MGPYGNILDNTGPYGTIQDHTGPYGSICVHRGETSLSVSEFVSEFVNFKFLELLTQLKMC